MKPFAYIRAVSAAALAFSPSSAGSQATPSPSVAPDAPTWQAQVDPRAATHASVTKRSTYITAADGTRLAADIYLPAGIDPGTRLPTIVEQTRYYRSSALKSDPVGSCRAVPSQHAFFARRGYAVVVIDVRGSGASFGTRSNELSDAEVRDGAAIVDWVLAQPWSNGRVGATGISYSGNTAELILRNQHSAIKAVAPVSAGYDFYSDLDFPGGVRNRFFLQNWAALNAALDSGQPSTFPLTKVLAGPCPVDADKDGTLLQAAIAEHAGNLNSNIAIRPVNFRDDPWAEGGGWPSAYLHRKSLDASRTPLLSIVGWTDAGNAKGSIHRFINSRSPEQRLIVGAADHGLKTYYAPGLTKPLATQFKISAELLRFFDHYVAGTANGYDREPRLRWFTTGANRWNAADKWPQNSATLSYCFATDRTIRAADCGPARSETFIPTTDAQTGPLNRWTTALGSTVAYGERSAIDARLLTYTSQPLTADLEVTGSPIVTLRVTNSAKQADYFIYLEEVDPTGRSFYVTEGMLRASHSRPGEPPYRTILPRRSDLRRDALSDVAGRALTLPIGLLPFSHRFKAGSRLRLAIAGSDKEFFDSPPLEGQEWTVRLGNSGSALTLPLARAAK